MAPLTLVSSKKVSQLFSIDTFGDVVTTFFFRKKKQQIWRVDIEVDDDDDDDVFDFDLITTQIRSSGSTSKDGFIMCALMIIKQFISRTHPHNLN